MEPKLEFWPIWEKLGFDVFLMKMMMKSSFVGVVCLVGVKKLHEICIN